MVPLICIPKVVKYIETECKTVIVRDGGMGNYYLMSTEVQFEKVIKILEMNGGNGCTI